jgi:nucleoid DNA-binding protein
MIFGLTPRKSCAIVAQLFEAGHTGLSPVRMRACCPYLFFYRSYFFMAAKKSAGASKKPPTKSEIYTQIADDTGLTKKDVAAVFESLSGQIKKNLGGRGAAGMFTIPGLLKMRVAKKAATKERMGRNPFTGEEMMFKAKPASKTVKVSALKGLKDMV